MIKRTFLFTVCAAFIGSISSISVFAQDVLKKEMMQKHNHEVPLDSAKKYIANLKKDAMQMRTKGSMFFREGLEKVLRQKGCIGVRFYYAKMDDGTPTLVAVGVDSTGNDLTKGVLLEKVAPCPPFCAEASELQK